MALKLKSFRHDLPRKVLPPFPDRCPVCIEASLWRPLFRSSWTWNTKSEQILLKLPSRRISSPHSLPPSSRVMVTDSAIFQSGVRFPPTEAPRLGALMLFMRLSNPFLDLCMFRGRCTESSPGTKLTCSRLGAFYGDHDPRSLGEMGSQFQLGDLVTVVVACHKCFDVKN